MTPEQRSEAMRLAEEWRTRPDAASDPLRTAVIGTKMAFLLRELAIEYPSSKPATLFDVRGSLGEPLV